MLPSASRSELGWLSPLLWLWLSEKALTRNWAWGLAFPHPLSTLMHDPDYPRRPCLCRQSGRDC